MGASVAALALKYPALVRGLVLASGYYYPTMRLDVVAMAAPAMPLFGDLYRLLHGADRRTTDMAADTRESVRPPAGTGQIHKIPKRNGASPFANLSIRL